MPFAIPEHKNCIGCGQCCGVIPVEVPQVEVIKRYFNDKLTDEYKLSLKNQVREPLTCQFRDEVEKKCAIYPVRPTVCRLMGVVEGMKCPNGNTVEIDGKPFMGHTCILMPKLY